MKLTNNGLVQVDGLSVPRNRSSVNACAKLPIKDTIDVCCGEFRIVGQQVINGLLNLGKACSGILELENFFDTEEHTHEEWIRVPVCRHRRVQSLYSWLEAGQHAFRQ